MKKALFSKLHFLLFCSLVGLDVFTKVMVLRFVPFLRGAIYPFGGIPIFENFHGVSFSLNTVTNTGLAWGLFPDHTSLLFVARLIIIAALFYLFLRSDRGIPSLAMWVIVAGAVGNMLDMISYGHVIDFFHFRFFDWSFPIFNVADSCITIGAGLLFLLPYKKKVAAQ